MRNNGLSCIIKILSHLTRFNCFIGNSWQLNEILTFFFLAPDNEIMSSSLPTPSQYANCQFPTPSYQLPVSSSSLFSRVAKQQVGPQFGQRKKKKRDRVMLSLWPNRKSAQMKSSQPVSRTFRFAFVCCVTREIPCAQRISHRFDRKSRMRDGRKSGKIADRSPFAALRLTSFRFSLFGIVHRIF